MTQMETGRAESNGGFSLVELLIVIFIVGLLSSVAIMTLPQSGSPAVRASDDIAVLLNRLSRESILLGEPVRWRHHTQYEQFDRYRLGEWTPLYTTGGYYDRVSFHDDVYIDISMLDFSGKKKVRPANVSRRLSEKQVIPTIVFLPTGEATAASIKIRDLEHQVEMSLTSDGDLIRTGQDGRS